MPRKQAVRTRRRSATGPNSPFKLSYATLAAEFGRRGIPTSLPDFCDHPQFLQVENQNPGLLNNFAAFVAKRAYDHAYIARSERLVRELSSLLHAELVANGRDGACVDVSGILLRSLHAEGIWSCEIKGSLTIEFPPESGLQRRYFWSVDHGEFVAGHAWVFAPPYSVVDVAVRQQAHQPPELRYIPDMVLSRSLIQARFEIDDIVSPSARAEMLSLGIPPGKHLESAPHVPAIFAAFPATDVHDHRGASLKYIPVAVLAPDGSFEDMRNMSFDGLTPWQLYRSKLAPRLRELGL